MFYVDTKTFLLLIELVDKSGFATKTKLQLMITFVIDQSVLLPLVLSDRINIELFLGLYLCLLHSDLNMSLVVFLVKLPDETHFLCPSVFIVESRPGILV